MSVEPVTLLRELAKRLGKRVRKINLLDRNVCTSPISRERPWEILALPGDMFRHFVNFEFAGRQVKLLASGELLVVQVRGSLDVEVLSFNRQDKVFNLQRSSFQIDKLPSVIVFARGSCGDIRGFLGSPDLQRALTLLLEKPVASLHIYRNGLVLYDRPEASDEVLLALDALCDLASRLPTLKTS
jgi:hypothetical protein